MNTFKILSIVFAFLSLSAFKNLSEHTGYDIGDNATDFKLENVDGKMISLGDYKNAKGFIVIFTCNTCPYAQAYEDRIISLDKKYKSKGYPVIAIMPNNTEVKPDDGLPAMKSRAESKGFEFPYLIDKDQTIYPQYGATKTPHVFVLQKEGTNNVVKYIGAIDDNYKDAAAVTTKYVESAVEALINGDQIKETKTRAIGCSIKA